MAIRRVKAADGIWWKYKGFINELNKHYLICGNTAKYLTEDDFQNFINTSRDITYNV